MKSSTDLNELFAALSAAQGQMGGAQKNGFNPHFQNSYSDLTSVVNAIKAPFAANGLCYTHLVGALENGCVEVTTVIGHASGQWLSSTALVPVTGKQVNAQALGSAISYGKRYTLLGLSGIPSNNDDDGEAAVAPDPQPIAPPPHSLPPAPPPLEPEDPVITEEEFLRVKENVVTVPGLESRILAAMMIKNLKQLPSSRLQYVLARIDATKAQANKPQEPGPDDKFMDNDAEAGQ